MTSGPAVAIGRLEAALVDLGDALAQADLGRLLSVELALSAALHGLAETDATRLQEDVRPLIEASRAALERCRRLGASLMDFTQVSLNPSGQRVYSREGVTEAAGRSVLLQARG